MTPQLLLLAVLANPAAPVAAPPNGARIEQLTGARGALHEGEGVYRVSLPRSDLDVYARGVRVAPGFGLTSWASFRKAGAKSLVLGELVLLEDQLDAALSAALDAGLEVTGVHHHFLGESPRVVYLHLTGTGEESALAAGIGKVFEVAKRKTAAAAMPALADVELSAQTALDVKKLEGALGMKGRLEDGVYRVSAARSVKEQSQVLGEAMGIASWAAFTAHGDQAATTGAFLATAEEVQGLVKSLRASGLTVTAMHPLGAGEPRLVAVHFWGSGATDKLARAVKFGFDQTRNR
ncbi:MAG: DUF1259 domain-containing protein [Myxococcales bacterium]